ncbi:MAG: PAS domain-containing protein [Lentisphaerae bacterium]|nr:PAS domain-containing protein [Lentisphaerota bacterium]
MGPPCILLTRDDVVARRIEGQLHGSADVTRVASSAEVLAACRQHDPLLLIMDLGWHVALEACREVRRCFPDTQIIALGSLRADPMLEATALGVYACEPHDIDRLRLKHLVRNAYAHLAVLEENRSLRDLPPPSRAPAASPPLHHAPPPPATLPPPLPQVFHHLHDIDHMLRGVLETAATNAGVSRAGIFAQAASDTDFRLRAGMRCLPETESLIVDRDDEFVDWMYTHAHVAARLTLAHIEPPATRIMIKRWLDHLGAEVILPLHGHSQLIGWLFVGHLSSGMPLDHSNLSHLIAIAHDLSVVLENGLLSEEATVQKTLAETVLGSIPAGIVAIDAGSRIQWCNGSAGQMLGLAPDTLIGKSPSLLGARLADMLIRAAHGEAVTDPVKWTDPITQLPLAVMTRMLTNGDTSLGAVAILNDLSQERLILERQERIDRATFWTELAAAISHEVRNPLVAISTFAQLLPDRYSDPEFREQFSELAVSEIGRLNAMIDQINDFANPPELSFITVHLGDILTASVQQAKEQLKSGIPIRVTADPSLPPVRGDLSALLECFTHIVCNAIEALQNATDPSILVVATGNGKSAASMAMVRIQDNGPGIPPAIVDKLFSPFCTMKARGIGLGLPIAKRTIIDHNGHIDIETGSTGTTITVSLPIAVTKEAPQHEASYSGHR